MAVGGRRQELLAFEGRQQLEAVVKQEATVKPGVCCNPLVLSDEFGTSIGIISTNQGSASMDQKVNMTVCLGANAEVVMACSDWQGPTAQQWLFYQTWLGASWFVYGHRPVEKAPSLPCRMGEDTNPPGPILTPDSHARF